MNRDGANTAAAALARLREGNQRFANNVRSVESLTSQMQRNNLTGGQKPIAIILGCSDSRAPAEILFDQGLGDLFVIRVAGNIVAPSQVGSVEFAAENFGTRLVVVMGHTHCGAIAAALDAHAGPADAGTRNLRSITDRLRPSVDSVLHSGGAADGREACEYAIMRANVHVSADHLRHGSSLLERLGTEDGLRVVGGAYHLATGLVDFFDGADLLDLELSRSA